MRRSGFASGYRSRQLIIPIGVTQDVQTAGVSLFAGDTLESIRLSLALTAGVPIAPTDTPPFVTLRAIADNNFLKTGTGVALPARSQFDLIPTLSVWPDAPLQTVNSFDVVSGATTQILFGGSFGHVLPCFFVCDESTRDIYISVNAETWAVGGFVALVVRGPASE